MNTRTANIILGVIMLGTFAVGAWVYPDLPDKLASHWDTAGKVNGYIDKVWGVFLMPAIMALFTLFFVVVPVVDPLKEHIASFRGEYNLIMIAIDAFFAAIYGLMMLWYAGGVFPMTEVITGLVGLLMICIGVILPFMQRNWFVGIRTPWTLSSDSVWIRTHEHGGVVFVFAGVCMVICSIYFPGTIVPTFALLIISAVWLVIYSYIVYHKELRGGGQDRYLE